MGKTRDLFKKIRCTKGTFHAKLGLIKDKNDMDLTEAEDIKKRRQEYTEELYQKDLHDPDNHGDDVITHEEPDILEYEVKWALGSITTNKASGYEVMIVRYSPKDVEYFGNMIPAGSPILPSNEQFGSYGWHYNRFESADKKFKELLVEPVRKGGRKSNVVFI